MPKPILGIPSSHIAHITCDVCSRIKKEKQEVDKRVVKAVATPRKKLNLNLPSRKEPIEDKHNKGIIDRFKEVTIQQPSGATIERSQMPVSYIPQALVAPKDWEKMVSEHDDASKIGCTFNTQERICLNEIFSDLSLDDDVCLFETLAVDLLKYIELNRGSSDLNKTLSKSRDEFCYLFMNAYLTMMIERAMMIKPEEAWIKNFFYKSGMPSENYLFLPRKEIVLRLQQWRKSFLSLCKGSPQMEEKIVKRTNLMMRLLLHPQAEKLLIGLDVRHMGALFSAPSLSKDDPRKTLKDLIRYVKLLSLGYKQIVKKNNLKLTVAKEDFLSELHKKLRKILKGKSSLVEANGIKEEISEHQSMIKKEIGSLNEVYKKVLAQEKSQNKLIAKITFDDIAFMLNNYFSDDFLRIFDQQILSRIDANHTSVLDLLNRFKVNLGILFIEIIKNNKPISIKDAGVSDILQEIIQPMVDDIEALLKAGIFTHPYLYKTYGYFQKTRLQLITHWTPVFQELKEAVHVLDHVNHTFEELRIKHLSLFREWIQTLDANYLLLNRSEIIENFDKLTFFLGEQSCRFVMMAKDLEQFLKNGVNAEDVGEEGLLTKPLIEYLGLSMDAKIVLDEVLAQKTKVPVENKNGPGKSQAKEKLKKPLPVQKSKDQLPPVIFKEKELVLPDFSKEKMKNIIPKLKALGFFYYSQEGSHSKFKTSDGQCLIVQHADQGDYRLPTGTAHKLKGQLDNALINSRSNELLAAYNSGTITQMEVVRMFRKFLNKLDLPKEIVQEFVQQFTVRLSKIKVSPSKK